MKVTLSTGMLLISALHGVTECVYITGERGIIDGTFGTSGKFRVSIPGTSLLY